MPADSETTVPVPASVPRLQLPSDLDFSTHDVLDLSKHNWVSWKVIMVEILQMSALDDYITGDVLCPDAVTSPESHRNWKTNDKMVRSLLSFRSAFEEKMFLKDFATAKEAWDALKMRHTQQRAYSQVLLLYELFQIRFDRSERLASTTSRIRDLVDRIFAIGTPSDDSLLCCGLFNAMAGDLSHLQSQVCSDLSRATSSAPYSSTQIIAQLSFEQQLLDESTHSDAAMVVKRLPRHSGPKPFCSNCKQSGHRTNNCFQEGGKMFGRKDEVLAKKRATRRSGKPSSSSGGPSGQRFDARGRAFVVDATSNTAYFL